MKRFLFVLLLLLVNGPASPQGSRNDMWQSANDKYAASDFEGALAIYKEIEELGFVSDALLYNIGNCYFKTNRIANSILYYEKALKLNPSGRDILYNLALAKEYTADRIEEVPEFILKTWIRDVNYTFSSDIWAFLSIALLFIALILLLVFRYGPSLGVRKFSFFLSMFSIFIGVIFTLFAWNQRNAYNKEESAIVMMPVSPVRNSPDGSGSTLFILHEGTKLNLIESLGNWVRIELADGRQGWIFGDDIEII